MKPHFTFGLAAATVMGCSEQKLVCPLILSPGVDVVVRDSVTGALTASGAKLVARAGAYVDSSSFPAGRDDAHLFGAYRPGVYTVTVTKPGYADWVKGNVAVTPTDCGVNRVDLTALLQPGP